jgi:ATP-binding cassette subfamily F protein 3
MQPIAELIEERVAPFTFPSPAKPLSSPLLRLERAAVGYGDGHPVLQKLDLRLDADDRIGLLGANGNGKSTLAKLVSGRLPPMAGDLHCPRNLSVGYFAQHQIDELPAGRTPYHLIAELLPDGTETQRRTRLGALGFGSATADTPCENLSGGERARLLLALVTLHGPHLLILDEPTNHLDVDAREALARALSDYEGAVIMISHDRHLLDACADRLWVARSGTVRVYDGDLDSYRSECLADHGAEQDLPRARPKADATTKRDMQQARRRAADLRATLAPLKERQKHAEAAIEGLAIRIATIDAALADGALFARDGSAAQKLLRERGELVRERTAAEATWLAAGEAYERATQEPDERSE